MNNIKLTILGSGVMVPTVERNPAGFLVEVGDKKILLDAGHGVIRRLTDYGFILQDIDLVLATHFHTDHFADVFPLVHSRWVDDTYTGKTNQGLLIWGPAGTTDRFKLWRQIFWVEPEEDYPVKFKEGVGDLKLGAIKISAFQVEHVKWFQSIGFIIEFEGQRLINTGDIGSRHDFASLVGTCRDADLVITEASYTEPTPNHFTINQVKKLVKEAGVKKVLVAHIRPQYLKPVEKLCREDKRFVLGLDGKRVII